MVSSCISLGAFHSIIWYVHSHAHMVNSTSGVLFINSWWSKENLSLTWHCSMCEPFFDTTGHGVIQTDISKQKFLELREHALQLPKFGTNTANDEVSITGYIAFQWYWFIQEFIPSNCSWMSLLSGLQKKWTASPTMYFTRDHLPRSMRDWEKNLVLKTIHLSFR